VKARRIAWGVWATTVALIPLAIALAVLASDVPLPEGREEFWPLVAALIAQALVYGTVGAIVASRRSRNAIGWIFAGIGLALALVATAYGYADYGLYGGGDVPLPRLAGWITSWLFVAPVFIAPCLVLFLFPDGRPPSPRWGRMTWLYAVVGVAALGGSAFEPGELVSYPGIENPLGLAGRVGDLVQAVDAFGEAVGAPAVFLLSLAALISRYRRANESGRLQIKWVAYAATVMVVCFAASFVVGEILPAWLSDVLFILGFAAFGGIAVAAGSAILRYRLYDIDVVINRTLVYALLTALLAGTYLGLVLLLQLVFQPLTQDSDLAIAGSTLAVAALFRPVRTRIQHAVDRRFYRRKYDAERTLEAFGARLREEVDLEALAADVRGVVRESVQPAHVSLWLREGSR
jgi:hypothetical protein